MGTAGAAANANLPPRWLGALSLGPGLCTFFLISRLSAPTPRTMVVLVLVREPPPVVSVVFGGGRWAYLDLSTKGSLRGEERGDERGDDLVTRHIKHVARQRRAVGWKIWYGVSSPLDWVDQRVTYDLARICTTPHPYYTYTPVSRPQAPLTGALCSTSSGKHDKHGWRV